MIAPGAATRTGPDARDDTDGPDEPEDGIDDTPPGRILREARAILVRDAYSGLRMDTLAFALGMSKKTLYAHFASKDALVAAVLDASGRALRRRVAEAMAAPGPFTDRCRLVLRLVAAHLDVLTPALLQDLQRFAPGLHRKIDARKDAGILRLLRQVLELGIAQGSVRDDLEVGFVAALWLQILKGFGGPAAIPRGGFTPSQAIDRAIDLLFRGLLTPVGRRQYARRRVAR